MRKMFQSEKKYKKIALAKFEHPFKMSGFKTLIPKISLSALFIMFNIAGAIAQQRFPRPEFESGYSQPHVALPNAKKLFMEYLDVFVLLISISLATWLVLKKRSRKWVLWMTIFSVVYFGFYRKGCICTVGSIQNVTLALFSNNYILPLSVLLFFLIPLIFSLFFGRTFCSGVCPLGAIQDLVIIKPMKLPLWLRKTLGLFPFLYLGLAVLYASTGTDFVICRFDPFVGIYRLDGPFNMIIIGAILLGIGTVVARPYCRFLCPYSVLLNWTSRFSWKHMSITPSNCIQCKLCENSCPFEAIDYPALKEENTKRKKKNYFIFLLITPLLALVMGFAFSKAHFWFASGSPEVNLAQTLTKNPELMNQSTNVDIQTFMASGKKLDVLIKESETIIRKFYIGSWLLGIFMGLVIGLSLANLMVFRKRSDYQPDKAACLSCARCMDFCPVSPNEKSI